MPERTTLDGDVPDTYQTLMKVFGAEQAYAEVIEGTLNFLTAGTTLRMQPRGTSPTSTARGQEYGSGSFLGLGPIRLEGGGWRIDEIWVKETVAAAGAVVVFVGILRDPEREPISWNVTGPLRWRP